MYKQFVFTIEWKYWIFLFLLKVFVNVCMSAAIIKLNRVAYTYVHVYWPSHSQVISIGMQNIEYWINI